jgi:hypothetical protein
MHLPKLAKPRENSLQPNAGTQTTTQDALKFRRIYPNRCRLVNIKIRCTACQTKIAPRIFFGANTCKLCTRKVFAALASPSRPGFARISSIFNQTDPVDPPTISRRSTATGYKPNSHTNQMSHPPVLNSKIQDTRLSPRLPIRVLPPIASAYSVAGNRGRPGGSRDLRSSLAESGPGTIG